MKLYEYIFIVVAVVLLSIMLSLRHVRADSTSVTTTPQATITTTITPDRTITTIVSPPLPSAPLVASPPVPAPSFPSPQVPAAPQPFMPEISPPPSPPSTPAPPAAKPKRYPTVPPRQCPCPDPTYYEDRYYEEHFPPVPADRVMRSTATCNGVGC